MRAVRTAIVGTGGIAATHARAVRELGGRLELVAAVDIDPARLEAFRAEHGVSRGYVDTREMLATERPDLVQVCTPPALHCALSIQCLEAGAWVLCEKPLCASLSELDRIEAAEQQTGRYCSSVFQLRFGSAAQHLRRLVLAGALGRPLVAVCHTLWYRDHAYYEVPWRGTWESELGGATMSQGIHALDLLLFLLGDWQEVRAMMGTLDRAIEVEDVSMAVARFQNGALASIVNSVLSPRQESYLRLDFQRATIEAAYLYGYANRDWRVSVPADASDSERERLARLAAPPDVTPPSHASQLAALLACMERGERPPTSGAEARRTVEFITSLYKAALTGEPVVRGSITADDPFYHGVQGAAARARVGAL